MYEEQFYPFLYFFFRTRTIIAVVWEFLWTDARMVPFFRVIAVEFRVTLLNWMFCFKTIKTNISQSCFAIFGGCVSGAVPTVTGLFMAKMTFLRRRCFLLYWIFASTWFFRLVLWKLGVTTCFVVRSYQHCDSCMRACCISWSSRLYCRAKHNIFSLFKHIVKAIADVD